MKNVEIFMGLGSGFLFGMATPLSKLIVKDLNPFFLAGLLYVGAALAMLPWAIKDRSRIVMLFLTRKTLIKNSGIVFFGGLCAPVLLMLGLRLANAASVAIWLNFELVATAFLGVFIFR